MQVTKIENKAITFPQLRGSLAGLHYPCMAEIKYDGEFNYLSLTESDACLINKYGTVKRDFPMLNDIVKVLRDNKTVSATFVCELYWNTGKLGALYEFLAHKKDDACKLCLFDIIELNGVNIRTEDYLDRKERMQEAGVDKWLPKCWVVNDIPDTEHRFKEVTDDGWEGITVKSFNGSYVSGPCSWVKMKFKDQSDYEVVLVDSTKERIEIVALYPNGIRVTVGVKASNRYKKHISIGDMVTVEHQGVLASGSLRHPVLIAKKEWK